MKPIDGTELALWFQQQYRPQISSDVARYVAEFDQFRETLEQGSSAERGAYLDLPKRLFHQWEVLAPTDARAGKMATFPVQVMSDKGDVVVGVYRALVGMDRRIRLDDDNVEWVPSFQRGVPIPRRRDDAHAIKPKDSTEPLGGFVGLLATFSNAINERADAVEEVLEDDIAYSGSYGRRGREMPVHRSTKDEIGRRAATAAKGAVKRLAVPWAEDSDLTDSENLYAWLKRTSEPRWLTRMSDTNKNKIWELLKRSGGDLYKTFRTQWAEDTKDEPTQSDFWGFMAFYITVNSDTMKSWCSQFEKGVKFDHQGVCKETACKFHPSRNRGILTKSLCAHQSIEARK